MSRKRPKTLPEVAPEEADLFRSAVGPVRRLQHDRVYHPPRRPSPRPRFRELDEQAVKREMLHGDLHPAELETGDELLFFRPGLQHSVLRRLRRGQFTIEAEFDLHGMTVPVARQALAEFLHAAGAHGQRCVRIIHGKGHGSHQRKPVLKSKVDHWLRQRRDVLAFCSARQVDGGTGAVYVLLRRPR